MSAATMSSACLESPVINARRVRALDPQTVNQIAAGEVVERPASVVKELVENALDAGASRVQVELVDSGKSLIRVSDDGCGMEEEDAVAALERHATSKIRTASDLCTVGTLGFRGEALPSIASVSRFSISTGLGDGSRVLIPVEGGAMSRPSRLAGPAGTEVRVEDIFFNVPARLKFLKSDTTELAACLEHLSKYAIGYPSVAFDVAHNGQSALRTTGSGDLHTAISEVWGRDVGRALAEVDSCAAGCRVYGFVTPPHVTRPTRAYQYIYVNGRPVRSRTLYAALDQAFRDLTPERRYPVVVLALEIPSDRVDINVSPTKSEVKFQSEGQAFDAIRYAIRSALIEHGMMPSAGSIAAANEAIVGAAPSLWLGVSSGVGGERSVVPIDGRESIPVGAPAVSFPSDSKYPFANLLDGLHIIGQAMNTFIIAETARGIAIIDQHVAHERILYEYLCGLKGQSAIDKQSLLVPETLHLDRRAAVLLRDRLGEIEAVGFEIEPFGGESFIVRAAPAAIRGQGPLKVLQDLVDELVEEAVTKRLAPTREKIWITSACKMAVKAGDRLSLAEMEKLIMDLAETENPYLCPHGRPITITLGRDELLRKFGRT